MARVVGGPARRRVILLLAAVLGLSTADSGAIGALAAPLEKSFHVGNIGLGLLVAVTTLIGAVATLPFGALADRWDRTRMLQWAVLTWGVATLVSAFSVSYGMLLATRMVLGILVAGAGPFVVSLAGDLFPADERSRLFGFVLTGELVGAGFGIIAAGTLSSIAGWRPALGVLCIPAFILVWGLRRYLPEPARGGQSVLEVGAATIPATSEDPEPAALDDNDQPVSELEHSLVLEQAEEHGVTAPPGLDDEASEGVWGAVRYILKVRTNVVLIVASGLGYFFLQGLQTFAELYFRDRFGIGQSLASVLFIFIGAGAIIGVLAAGRIADALIERGVTTARLSVAAVGFVGCVVFFVPAMLSATLAISIPLFVIAAAAIGGVNPPLDAARLDVMPAHLWGRAEAVRTALRTLLQGTAPLIFGFVSTGFGAKSFGFGAGIDTSNTAASASSGHAFSQAFLVLAAPVLIAGLVVAAGRHRYLRDVVAASHSHRSHSRQANPT